MPYSRCWKNMSSLHWKKSKLHWKARIPYRNRWNPERYLPVVQAANNQWTVCWGIWNRIPDMALRRRMGFVLLLFQCRKGRNENWACRNWGNRQTGKCYAPVSMNLLRVIGHFVCFLMSMKLVFIGLYWHLFFLRRFLRVDKKCCKKISKPLPILVK